MKPWLIVINNFVHDLFTGLWCSALLTIYLLERKAPRASAEASKDLMKFFFVFGIVSLLVVVITGIFRSVYYRDGENGTVAAVKKRALIVKHILLGTLFLAGTYLAYSYTFN